MTLEASIYGDNVNVVLDPYLVNNLDQEQLSKLQTNLSQNNDMVLDLMDEIKENEGNEVTETLKQKIDKKLIKLNVLEVKDGEINGSQLIGAEYLETRYRQCKDHIEKHLYGTEGFLDNIIDKTKDFFSFSFNSVEGVSNTLTRLLSVLQSTDKKELFTILNQDQFEMFNIKGVIPKDFNSELTRFVKTINIFSKEYSKSILEQQTDADKTISFLEQNIKFVEFFKITSDYDDEFQKVADKIISSISKRPRFKLCNISFKYDEDPNLDVKISPVFPGNYCFEDIHLKNIFSIKDGKDKLMVTPTNNKSMTRIIKQYADNERSFFGKLKEEPSYSKKIFKITKEQAISVTKHLFELLQCITTLDDSMARIAPSFSKSFKASFVSVNPLSYLIKNLETVYSAYHLYYANIFSNFKSSCDFIQDYIFKLIKAWNNLIHDCLEE